MLGALVSAHAGTVLGLTSLGYDGEEMDTVSFLPKPQVHLPVGSLLATAQECLPADAATYQVLSRTGVQTGLGEVLIVRVLQEGDFLLAGPSTAQGMAQIKSALLAEGADKLLIDGAFSRQSHSMAGDALIYVVGAQKSRDMHQVVAGAALMLRKLGLPQAEKQYAFLAEQTQAGWLDHQGRFHSLRYTSTLGHAEDLLGAIGPDANWLYLPGAVDAQLVDALVQRRREIDFGLIVRSPLSLVIEDHSLGRLFALGKPIQVLNTLQLAFVALNPFAPAGYRFEYAQFLDAMSAVTNLPRINVLEEDF